MFSALSECIVIAHLISEYQHTQLEAEAQKAAPVRAITLFSLSP